LSVNLLPTTSGNFTFDVRAQVTTKNSIQERTIHCGAAMRQLLMCPAFFFVLGGIVSRCFFLLAIELVEVHGFTLADLRFVQWRDVDLNAIRQEDGEIKLSISIIRRHSSNHKLSSTIHLTRLSAENALDPRIALLLLGIYTGAFNFSMPRPEDRETLLDEWQNGVNTTLKLAATIYTELSDYPKIISELHTALATVVWFYHLRTYCGTKRPSPFNGQKTPRKLSKISRSKLLLRKNPSHTQ